MAMLNNHRVANIICAIILSHAPLVHFSVKSTQGLCHTQQSGAGARVGRDPNGDNRVNG